MTQSETSEHADTKAEPNEKNPRTCHANGCDEPLACLVFDGDALRNSVCGHRQPLTLVQSRAGEEAA